MLPAVTQRLAFQSPGLGVKWIHCAGAAAGNLVWLLLASLLLACSKAHQPETCPSKIQGSTGAKEGDRNEVELALLWLHVLDHSLC